jgi:hypothetical protein
VFDTAFHATIPEEASAYAIPRSWREDWGVRRYGFHGLSVQWCAERVPILLGRSADDLRLVICHLGGGCSVTAVRDGRSLDTTMGFSPLEGIPMATRSGSLDPGAVLYLMRERSLDARAIDPSLNFDSGLKGLAQNRAAHVKSSARPRLATGLRGWPWTCSSTAWQEQSPQWLRQPAASTRSCSPASGRTPRSCAHARVSDSRSSGWSSNPRSTPLPGRIARWPPRTRVLA